MIGRRDTSRDGFSNKVEQLVLTNFKGLWQLLQRIDVVERWLNKLVT
jgi:prostaglandin-endoperoxide synthase 2